jgi:ribonuclease BN (tRNA processing enzyme)
VSMNVLLTDPAKVRAFKTVTCDFGIDTDQMIGVMWCLSKPSSMQNILYSADNHECKNMAKQKKRIKSRTDKRCIELFKSQIVYA